MAYAGTNTIDTFMSKLFSNSGQTDSTFPISSASFNELTSSSSAGSSSLMVSPERKPFVSALHKVVQHEDAMARIEGTLFKEVEVSRVQTRFMRSWNIKKFQIMGLFSNYLSNVEELAQFALCNAMFDATKLAGDAKAQELECVKIVEEAAWGNKKSQRIKCKNADIQSGWNLKVSKLAKQRDTLVEIIGSRDFRPVLSQLTYLLENKIRSIRGNPAQWLVKKKAF
ncbi:unnamed protein product [Protopolystoma xenopodis]|uniref:Uncharacterized protein n=1 Tax=Protopolystoma xenopodis TaxID=117903 RepID=A0A448XLG0_9PLAT|nr:unnamed protein product [Protopolystoma xenopodis]